MEKNEVLKCVVCNKHLIGRQKRYCSKECFNKHLHDTKYHTIYSNKQDNKGILRKYILIQERGGKCEQCGYNKNIASLQFHHLKDKQFVLDIRHLSRKSLENIRHEASKCILLCANCHHELHHPEYELDNLKELAQKLQICDSYQKLEDLETFVTNIKKELPKHYCVDCGKEITRGARLRCKTCSDKESRKTEWPTKEVLLQLVLTTPMTRIGNQYGVSDNAVRKWCKHYGIPSNKKEIKEYISKTS